jgi:hypothetical protein
MDVMVEHGFIMLFLIAVSSSTHDFSLLSQKAMGEIHIHEPLNWVFFLKYFGAAATFISIPLAIPFSHFVRNSSCRMHDYGHVPCSWRPRSRQNMRPNAY